MTRNRKCVRKRANDIRKRNFILPMEALWHCATYSRDCTANQPRDAIEIVFKCTADRFAIFHTNYEFSNADCVTHAHGTLFRSTELGRATKWQSGTHLNYEIRVELSLFYVDLKGLLTWSAVSIGICANSRIWYCASVLNLVQNRTWTRGNRRN